MSLQGLAAGLVSHLWESTVFAALAAAVLCLARPASPGTRHAVWTLALLKFLAPSALLLALFTPLVRLAARWLATPSPGAVVSDLAPWVAPVPRLEQAFRELPSGTPAWLLAAWSLGSLVVLGGALQQTLRARRELGLLPVVEAGREAELLRRAASRLGRRPPRLTLSERVREPLLWGVCRPRLVLPTALAGQLTDDELETLILHELLHARRHDNLTGLAGLVACAVGWAHPLVWRLSERARRERERACDEGVVAAGSGGDPYASALAKVVRFGFGHTPAGLSGAGGAHVRERLEAILRPGCPARTSVRDRLALCAAIALLLLLTASANPCLRS